jgi:TolB-like protein
MRKLTLSGGIVLIVVVLLICPPVQAQTPKKVLLIPFTLYAGEDMAYLQKGIAQMLTSRLTQQDKVEVLEADPAMVKGKDLAGKARSLGADYLLTGSLTLLGNSVSTDAKVMDLQQGKQVLTFNQVGKDQAAILDHVDQLAMRINETLFDRKPSGSAPTPSAATVPVVKDPEPSIYQHPEKLYTQTQDEHRPAGEMAGHTADASLMMRGRRVPFQMRGVTTADVDGDGQNDIVCIGPTTVIAYRIVQKQLVKLAEIKASAGHYVGVDALDVNGNGKAEIFVTNFINVNSRVSSFVVEWDGKDLARIAGNLNWFFRVVEIPGRGKVLAGQRQGIDEPFASSIHEMGQKGDSYGPMERLSLPRGLNIHGFAFGHVRSKHDTEVVAYNTGGFVRILNPRGEEEWITSERYGGSHLHLEFPNATDTSERIYVYLSPRIHLYDLDGDGIQEIFVIDNEDQAGTFSRVRLFKNGRLEALKWDELGMTPQWRTRNLAKYISDFTLADMDGDGNPEVVASVVQKSGIALSKAQSYLAVFNLAGTGTVVKTQ